MNLRLKITTTTIGVVAFFVYQLNAQKQQKTNLIQVSSWRKVVAEKGKIQLIMPYATKNNFAQEAVYPCATCLLRPEAYDALMKAKLTANKANLQLIIFDCYRPKAIQMVLYNLVKNEDFVALPKKGSMHNKGLAVDLGLASKAGTPLDMGTEFDSFSPKSSFSFKGLTNVQKNNRVLLRNIMMNAGFLPYEKEWWHFNYSKVFYQPSDSVWSCP
jgi:zinc D-Ala-D-Ala dipeptidase